MTATFDIHVLVLQVGQFLGQVVKQTIQDSADDWTEVVTSDQLPDRSGIGAEGGFRKNWSTESERHAKYRITEIVFLTLVNYCCLALFVERW